MFVVRGRIPSEFDGFTVHNFTRGTARGLFLLGFPRWIFDLYMVHFQINVVKTHGTICGVGLAIGGLMFEHKISGGFIFRLP